MADDKLTNTQLTKEVQDFLKDSDAWDKLELAIVGNISIVKMPTKKNQAPTIALALNPNNKKRETYFRKPSEYVKYLADMTESAESCLNVLKVIAKLNGTSNHKVEREGLKV